MKLRSTRRFIGEDELMRKIVAENQQLIHRSQEQLQEKNMHVLDNNNKSSEKETSQNNKKHLKQ